nr:MAG TPA: hypothetical protein [Caudoviricetes sp.]
MFVFSLNLCPIFLGNKTLTFLSIYIRSYFLYQPFM